MKALIAWLDDRTGITGIMHEALYERIPGGARWRYVWGSTLMFAFAVQVITGVFLWMAYAPSAQTAWESVWYIQNEMQGGWLLRGIHHFMAQAMVVLLALHLLQVVIDGAYRAPREVNFWLGLILMQVVLGLSLTGYLLPWDQKGFWATKVATNIAGIVPVVGPSLQRLAVGGVDYGQHTLTRFFALHAGVLPGLLIALIGAHLYVFRRHGITAHKAEGRPAAYFWPDQVLRDGVACLAVLAVVLLLVVRGAFTGEHAGDAPGTYLGADLGAPADSANPYSAARPEWYFLFLFQFLKFFPGHDAEVVGAIVIPGAVIGLMFLMPFIGKWKLGHQFNVGFICALLLGVGALTAMAMYEDRSDAAFAKAVEEAEDHAERMQVLASAPAGIPPLGALSLLRTDPKTQGPAIFLKECGSCHAYADANGQGLRPLEGASAPNLMGFASREWLAGLLDPEKVDGPSYFGNTTHKDGDMASWVNDNVGTMDDAAKAQLQLVIKALSAQAKLPLQDDLDVADAAQIEEGTKLLKETVGCADCHQFQDVGEGGIGPVLTGYGSRDWMIEFISNPGAEKFYGDENDRMPAFHASADAPRLSRQTIEIVVDWLRHDWYEPEAEPAPAPAATETKVAAE